MPAVDLLLIMKGYMSAVGKKQPCRAVHSIHRHTHKHTLWFVSRHQKILNAFHVFAARV